MQNTDSLAISVLLDDADDTWNQARSLAQLQAFITLKLDGNNEAMIDLT